MRIVLCCRGYPTQRPGGMLFICRDRAVELAKNHEVHVLTTGHTSRRSGTVDGVLVHHLKCKPLAYTTQFAEQCSTFCKRMKPDIIHCDSVDPSRLWWKDLKCKKALTVHGFCIGGFLTNWNLHRICKGPAPKFDASKWMEEVRAFKSFHTVIGTSIHEQWLLKDPMGIHNAKLVYNPIPNYFFDQPKSLPTTPKFLCAAVSQRGLRLFDVAVQAAKEAGIDLVESSNTLRHKMPELYDSVSALLVPSARSSGYDLTVGEALARCRPVITSTTGSYLREGEHSPYIIPTALGNKVELVKLMKSELPVVPQGYANKHRPEEHVKNWLEAI